MPPAYSCLIAVLGLVFLNPSQCTEFTVRNGRVKDTQGRERYFHGVNVVYKSPPYHPLLTHFHPNLSFVAEDGKLLQSLGVNVIRLGTMWPGIEPSQGHYNQSYLNALATVLKTCETYGIYALMDAHQDCLSEILCGEGIPNWATHSNGTKPFPYPLQEKPFKYNPQGIPYPDECAKHSWSDYQLTEAGSMAYQNLYKNHFGLADSFGRSWSLVAKTFKQTPNIVGVELLNEPFAGYFYDNPLLMYPGVADKENLQPFYDKLEPYIHSEDPDRLIFFESTTWDDAWGEKIFDVGFTHPPGHSTNASVLSYHYYSSLPGQTTNAYLDERVHDGKRLGITSFVTEFDIDNGGETEKGLLHTCDVMQKFEERQQSWIGWEYKSFAGSLKGGTCTGCGNSFFHNDGKLNKKVAQALSRPYVSAVQGRLLASNFNCTSQQWTFTVELDPTIKAETEIRLSKVYWFKTGFHVSVNPPKVKWVPTSMQQGTVYELSQLPGQAKLNVTVTIMPA
eukprot:TRINITY_DN49147_c0_g1_i1.p1 TRINITY_DN49147_c0_g1~~TRINITY_DN49147_c0_g1_i1.p1  ORF type:complete len:506 (-),score=47.68 TRINITY_DN49147_c0_g1_i1:40-1557(-)